MKQIQVSIKGISPLLMHAYPMTPVEGLEKKTPEEQAEVSAYRTPKTRELHIPSTCIQRALVAGAVYSKGKGRSTLTKVAAACLLVSPEYCGLGQKTFQVDARPVVIKATKGRIVRYRPRLDSWETTFTIEFDEILMKESEIRRIVDDTGSRVGLLDFRPACKGPFGRFMVTAWKAQEE